MLSLNWGTFFRAIRDWRNNTPLSKPTVSGTTVLQDLQNFELLLPQIKAWLAAHPGSITAADDILNTLPYTWAKELDSSITGLPDVVSAISEWLPRLITFLKIVQPPIPKKDLGDDGLGDHDKDTGAL